MTPVVLFELVLLFLMAALIITILAQKAHAPPAAILVIGGALLAALPSIPHISLNPDLIMLVFLPPLLQSAAYFTVWRDFAANLRPIMLLAIGAVAFTTVVVGVAAKYLVPSLPWACCFTLGAIVSPPDAVAAKAVLQRVPLPPRIITILEGESLVNDASGLLLYQLAVAATMTGVFSWSGAAGTFAFLTLGGLALGAAVGWLSAKGSLRIRDRPLLILSSFLVSWATYLLAEKLHVSGVLAVVACGMILGNKQHEYLDSESRLEMRAVWAMVDFVLEALIFVLIGLSLRDILKNLGGGWDNFLKDTQFALLVSLAVIIARLIWVFPATYVPRLLVPSILKRDPYPSPGAPFVISWAGMRGVVSLAAAMALPLQFPQRDLIIYTTFIVIAVTVLFQGSTLGLVVKWAEPKAPAPKGRWSSVTMGRAEARQCVYGAGLKYLLEHAVDEEGNELHPRIIEDYRRRVRAMERYAEEGEAMEDERREHFETALGALQASRDELLHLHSEGAIHESTVDGIESELDLEEIRFRRLAASLREIP